MKLILIPICLFSLRVFAQVSPYSQPVTPASYEQPISNDILVAGAKEKQARMERELEVYQSLISEINKLNNVLRKCNSAQSDIIDKSLSEYSNLTFGDLDRNYVQIRQNLMYIKNFTSDEIDKNCN